MQLTRRQQDIYDYLLAHAQEFQHPPTLEELCAALGLKSRGSMHKQVHALMDAGLVEPMNRRQRGVRLTRFAQNQRNGLPLVGNIAAGRPIDAVQQREFIEVPQMLRTGKPCFVLRVKGDSMKDAGILDGDFVIIEEASHARNGDIVVALVHGEEATLKRIEQQPGKVILYAENAQMQPLCYGPDEVIIQGILVGQMRAYGQGM